METKYSRDPQSFERMNTAEIRQEFLIADLFCPGELKLVYLHMERMIVGSAAPAAQPLTLNAGPELASAYFAERREVGVFNIGEPGWVAVDGREYPLANREFLYVGRGNRDIRFGSANEAHPALFYLVSLPAHAAYPTFRLTREEAKRMDAGSPASANQRTIYRYIHAGSQPTCQLVMGYTELAPGSVWNTMSAHTHERRSEVYLYFNLPGDNVVFHVMGRPWETRHVVVRDGQAVVSPSWSIHSGAGTSNYCFVWAMGGENQDYDDQDPAGMEELS